MGKAPVEYQLTEYELTLLALHELRHSRVLSTLSWTYFEGWSLMSSFGTSIHLEKYEMNLNERQKSFGRLLRPSALWMVLLTGCRSTSGLLKVVQNVETVQLQVLVQLTTVQWLAAADPCNQMLLQVAKALPAGSR